MKIQRKLSNEYTTEQVVDITVTPVSFDVKDAKGRTIGVLVTKRTSDMVPTEPPEDYRMGTYPAGRAYGARVQVTRDGQPFGAYQGTAMFTTEAERDAFVAKRIAGSRKRAGA